MEPQRCPAADLDGDKRSELVVTSPWGIGTLKVTGDTFNALMLAPNGTRFGGWLLNTGDNHFGPAADLDGNKRAEIVVSSPWGIGELGLQGNTLSCPTLQPYGSHLGDWILEKNDRVVGVDNLTGLKIKSELLIQKGA